MALVPISGLTQFSPRTGLLIPVIDPAAGSGLKNGSVTVGDFVQFAFTQSEDISDAPLATSLAATDFLGISIAGLDHKITLQDLAGVMVALGLVSAPAPVFSEFGLTFDFTNRSNFMFLTAP